MPTVANRADEINQSFQLARTARWANERWFTTIARLRSVVAPTATLRRLALSRRSIRTCGANRWAQRDQSNPRRIPGCAPESLLISRRRQGQKTRYAPFWKVAPVLHPPHRLTFSQTVAIFSANLIVASESLGESSSEIWLDRTACIAKMPRDLK
jgi:hypothetical protein